MIKRVALTVSLLALSAAPAHAGEWLAGDLHVHTTYSHDSYGGPGDDNTGAEAGYAFGFPVMGDFGIAAQRGMDFLAITDHNDVRASSDPGFGAFGIIGVPGYENSLSGHAQMLGATKLYAKPADPTSAGDVQALAGSLRADGGVFQVNHPANSETEDPDDVDWALGYAVQPETVEAWNGPRFWQPPLPSGNSHDDAIRYWQGWLDRGAKVAVTGGSDSHWVSTSQAQGPGQPTTYVYAEDRSVKGILDGLRAGRTMVSHQPPNLGGPMTFIEADANRDGRFESMAGDTVRPRTPLRARVTNAPGAFLRVVTDGGAEAFPPVRVTSADFTHRFKLPKRRTWAYAEVIHEDFAELRRERCPNPQMWAYCRNRILVLGMSSALYLEKKAPRRRGR